ELGNRSHGAVHIPHRAGAETATPQGSDAGGLCGGRRRARAGGATLINRAGDLRLPFARFRLFAAACADAPEEDRAGDGRACSHKTFLAERYSHTRSLPNCRLGDYGPRCRAGASTAPVTSKSTTPTASATGCSAPSCGPPTRVAIAT